MDLNLPLNMHLTGVVSIKRSMYLVCWTAAIVFLPNVDSTGQKQHGSTEYCQEETLTASCGENEAILMTSARYGRMNLGRCVKRSLGFLGCAADALPLLHSRCSGHGQCQMSIMDPDLRTLAPCPQDVTWHLEASYECVQVTGRPRHECRKRSSVQIQESSGYLSSEVAMTTSVGSPSCPWEIVAPPGQSINVTLKNFLYNSPQDGTTNNNAACVTVAKLMDPAKVPNNRLDIEACMNKLRDTYSYVSLGNRLQVIFPATRSVSAESQTQFLLKYQFLGCPDIIPQEGATVTREGDNTEVKCTETEETWYLTCEGNHWSGIVGNCSRTTAHQSWDIDDIFHGDDTFPFGILVVVAVGVALGIFLGGTLLLVVSVYMKRRHTSQEARAPQERTRGFHDTMLPEDYYRKQEVTELNYTEEAFSSTRGGRQPTDEYKITEYRPPFSQISYSSTTNTAPKNMPHVYESPKFS